MHWFSSVGPIGPFEPTGRKAAEWIVDRYCNRSVPNYEYSSSYFKKASSNHEPLWPSTASCLYRLRSQCSRVRTRMKWRRRPSECARWRILHVTIGLPRYTVFVYFVRERSESYGWVNSNNSHEKGGCQYARPAMRTQRSHLLCSFWTLLFSRASLPSLYAYR